MNIQHDPYINGITPPSFSLALMRIDTAFTALSDGLFQSDCEWFKQHGKRRLLIRRESNGEFDPAIVPQTHPGFHVCIDNPPLWVLVMRTLSSRATEALQCGKSCAVITRSRTSASRQCQPTMRLQTC
jgi:hypothetical protein